MENEIIKETALEIDDGLDDPTNQGDNLQPALDVSRRGAMYYRPNDGHGAGGMYIRWKWLRNFKRNQSFLAFTNRSYDDFTITDGLGSGIGYINDLTKHGWDPATIVDETNHYSVILTGTGTADVTLRNLQNFTHAPGTVYDATINSSPVASVTADEFGLVTIPAVANSAVIDLVVHGSSVEQTSDIGAVENTATPNPFNPAVMIAVSMQRAASGRNYQIDIYNVYGKLIQKLTTAACSPRFAGKAGQPPAGITWNALG